MTLVLQASNYNAARILSPIRYVQVLSLIRKPTSACIQVDNRVPIAKKIHHDLAGSSEDFAPSISLIWFS